MKIPIPLIEIITFLGDDVKNIYGSPEELFIHYLKASDQTDEYTLDWVNPAKTNKQNLVEQSKAKAILISESSEFSTELQNQSKVLIFVDNPKLTIAKVGNHFFVQRPKSGIHNTATIHPKAIIGKDVFIGAN